MKLGILKKEFIIQGFRVFVDGLWRNNPVFGMMLGVCSSLAVTTFVKNALVMGAAVTATAICSSLLVSVIRKKIPLNLRMMVYMLIISTLVIVVDRVLKLTVPSIARQLGPYVGLIITNCIIMGRLEAFAVSRTPFFAICDAAGCGLGYGLVLMMIAVFREVLGIGSIMGYRIMPESYEACGIFVMAPGAFFVLGTFIFIIQTLREIQSKQSR